VILNQIERAFMLIGDKVITASSGIKALDDYNIKQDNITSELVIMPRAADTQHLVATRQSLNSITKQKICDMCLETFGVTLNFRIEKKHLITEYLALQDNER
jgi:hypothetical protein